MANEVQNIIAAIEKDSNAVLATLVQDVANIRTGIANSSAPISAAIQTAEKDALAMLSSVGAVAAAPNAITISGAIIPVWNAFVDIFNLLKGFIEGIQGKPASGNSPAEQAGDAAGQAVDNFVKGVEEDLTGSQIAGPNAANPKGN